jgi:hypothetical protein
MIARSAFNFSEDVPLEDELLRINFLAFGYLVPYESIYDTEYLQWRLSQPREMDIYDRHLRYYLNLIGAKTDLNLSPGHVHSLVHARTNAFSAATHVLMQKQHELGERDKYISRLTDIVKARDAIVTQRDTHICELDRIIANRDGVIRECDQHIEMLMHDLNNLRLAHKGSENEKLRVQIAEIAKRLVIKSFNDKSFDAKLQRFILEAQQNAICLYGGGVVTNEFINNYDLSALNILGIIDRDPEKAGCRIGKYEIYPLNALKELKPDIVLITVVADDEVVPFVSKLINQYDLKTTIKEDLFFEPCGGPKNALLA